MTLTQVNVGANFTCALGSTGAAYCWGIGSNGDLGNNSTAGSLVPVAVSTSGVLSGVTLTQVSPGGGQFTCALDTFGTDYCWGANTTGQAGNPDTALNFLVPATVAPSQATMIAAGNIHSCQLTSGKAYCWGDNSNGELGNNSTMTSSVPVAVWTGGVLSGVTLTQIATGTNFSCALSAAGAAYCWGLGTSGQLGNNTTTSSSVPVAVYTGGVLSGVTLTQITANGATACVLSAAGAAYCWGAGGSGQLGNGSTTAAQSTAVAVTTSGTLSGVILSQVVTGGTSTCALTHHGAAFCWGAGGSGQLGNGSTTAAQSTAVAVTTSGVLLGLTLTGVTVGANFACALSIAGTAYCWGAGGSGQLGNGLTTAAQSTAVAVTTSGVLSGITLTQLDAASNSSCALSAAGLGYCWGGGAVGQLGNGSTTASQSTAVAVTATGVLSGQTLTQLTGGTTFTCALDNRGGEFCWGENSNGQAGNPDTANNFLVPVSVMSQSTMISTGYNHACLLRNGKAYCWGDDTYGELGNNTTTATPQSTPVPVYTGGVLSTLTLIQIGAGQTWTCALASNGNAYCWGNNSTGVGLSDAIALGNNTNTASSVPVLVSGGLSFTQISVGSDFACGLTSAGLAYCWGNNHSDQMGNGGTALSLVPVAVTATFGSQLYQLTLTQIAAGTGYACALASTGAAYCWGLGTSGQLGNSASSTAATAVAVTVSGVLSGAALVQISTGSTTTCALDSSGAAYCWGAGGSGQLGNGLTTATQTTAVAVTATSIGSPLVQITAGTSFACAVASTGAAYCWGLGTGKQLGNNLNTSSTTPVAVTATGALTGATLFQISSGQLATCTQDTTGAFYCWGTNTNGQLGNASTTSSNVPVVVAAIVPGPPTGVSATPGDTTATISWTAPASLGTGTLTGYTATATAASGTFTCTTASAVICVISGLTDGITYSVTVVTLTTDGNSPPSAATTVTPWPPPPPGSRSARVTRAPSSTATAYLLGRQYQRRTWKQRLVRYSAGHPSGREHDRSAVGQNPHPDRHGHRVQLRAGRRRPRVLLGPEHQRPARQQLDHPEQRAGRRRAPAACWPARPSPRLSVGQALRRARWTPPARPTAGATARRASSATTRSLAQQLRAGGLVNTGWRAGRQDPHPDQQPATSTRAPWTVAGAAYCWGYNGNGGLGNNSTTQSPVAVVAAGALSGKTITNISAGNGFSCALASAGVAYCWGLNTSGQLGINSTTQSLVPVAVSTAGALAGKTITQISVTANDHACALDATGVAYCWGLNTTRSARQQLDHPEQCAGRSRARPAC